MATELPGKGTNIECSWNSWLSKEEYGRQKVGFIAKNKGQFVDFFSGSEHFSNLTPDLREKGAELISRFFFGVWMAYRRIGFKYSSYNLTYDTGEINDYSGIGYNDESNSFAIKVDFMQEVLGKIKEKGNASISGMGIEEMVPTDDFFELAGVEEAAHLMFFNEYGHLGKAALVTNDSDISYHTSEIESRALIWKVGYVKRYMPQYYGSLKRTQDGVRKAKGLHYSI
mgnify:CR=1 FL=1